MGRQGVTGEQALGCDRRYSESATKQAVTGAIEVADAIGTDTAKTVSDVLTTSVKGAKDVIKQPFK